MPEVKGLASEILTLYERCKAHKALPGPGGLLAQPEWIMQVFDVIEATKLKVAKDKELQDFADYERRRQLNGEQ